MAMRSGMYSSNKRKKELMRQKKQEEKRLKRQKGGKVAAQEPAVRESMNNEMGSGDNNPEITGK
jgi:hypothetical protein